MAQTHSFITELAESFRRIKGTNDDGDLKTVWHQGRSGAEMLSWENADGVMRQQERSFYGQIILWDKEKGLHTASVSAAMETTHSGMSKADVVKPDTELSSRTLGHAEQLLTSVDPSDQYYEHLLEHVRAAVASS